MSNDIMMCATCGRKLEEWIDDNNELIGYGHYARDWRDDHVSVPIKAGTLPVRIFCDFCRDETPLAECWTLPAKSFDTNTEWSSVGDWCACELCAQQIQLGSWEGLTNRAVNGSIRNNSDIARLSKPQKYAIKKIMREDLVDLYRRLREHITGPLRRSTLQDTID